MNETKLSPDDPRLTAYALGELESGERAAIESALQNDPAARAAVDSIRATARQLEAAFSAEPAPEFKGTPSLRQAAIVPGHDHGKLDGSPLRTPLPKLVKFPRAYFVAAGLVAAGFAMMLVLYRPSPMRVAQKEKAKAASMEENPPPGYVEVPLTLPAKSEESGTQQAEAMAKMQVADAQEISQDKDTVAPAAANLPAALKKADETPAEETIALPSFSVSAARTSGLMAGRETMTGAVASPRAFNTEAYAYHADSDFLSVVQNPLSTFALDVDTASYANVRRFLQAGQRPPPDAVRIEELVNYFPYDYAPPSAAAPLAATLEVAAAPWAPAHRLVRIGLKAREVAAAARPAMNLVFLIDVSGSMDEPNKLPLVKESLRLLLGQLKPDDQVAIVTYAGESGLALPSTPASHKREILEAIDVLRADGSTNGARGLELAYDIAKANFVKDGVNRVILATDGDFNVGVTNEGDLTRLVEEKARSGVSLTALGFGTGNYKDAMFEQLADKGHGNYGYIDTLAEAKKLLVEQVGGTLMTVARDVKVQVEFNPAQASAYRLIGYEDRALKKEDFNNDAITAGDVGAGHTVTALYEVVPANADSPAAAPGVDALKYQKTELGKQKAKNGDLQEQNSELLTVKVRYTPPEGGPSRRLEFPLTDHGEVFADASMDFKFAAAVAGFGMILRDSPHKGGTTLADVEHWAAQGVGADAGGYRSEFLELVRRTEKLGE